MRKSEMIKILQPILFILIISGLTFGQNDTLTINQCVDLALKNNPQIRLAKSNYDFNYSNLVLTRSNIFPQVSLQSAWNRNGRSEEHTSELQSLRHLVCRL